MDLPTAWNLDDKSTCLSVDSSGLRVNYEGTDEIGAIRANHPIPPQCSLFYFEVDIIDEGKNKSIGIGFCEKTFNLYRMPGWDDGSWGYHGDDGKFFCCSRSNPYGPLFSTGDTIGCCLNFKNSTVFYTQNGVSLGIAFRNLKGTLYPCVALMSQGGSMEVNFGSRKFKFAATTCNDMGDELLKNKLIEAFNMCINMTSIYTLEDLENSLEIKQDTAALKFRGKFNFIMGSYEDAIIDLTKLLDVEQTSKFALRYRGETYYLMERYKEAIIDLTKLLDIEPNSKVALRYLGEIYHLTKEAIIDLAKLLGIEPNDNIDESLKKKLIDAFNMCNNVINIYTLEDLENSLEIKRHTALKFRGKFNFIMERYEDAIVDLTKSLEIEQTSKFALRYRGEAYHITERYKDAIIDLTKLFGIEPSDDVDELLKKKWIEAFNKCNNATNTYTLEDLENSLKIKQDSALKFRVKFNFILERYENAIIDLTKLLDIEPSSKFALRYRAEAYYLMEKYKESFNDVNKLLKIDTIDEWASKRSAKIIEISPCVDETYELGCFYLHGINVEKDEYKAFTYFEKSANMGYTEGINCLGYCYEYGIGVEKDENNAFTYYQKSADMNNSNGMYQVAYCYYLGIGVEIDKYKAFTYYLKSAEADNPMGVRKTAICYYFGIGVEQNNDKSLEWSYKDPIYGGYFYSYIDNRKSEYGKCAHCNEDNTNPAWCLSCDPDIATRWTVRNKDIDDCMKTSQLRARKYEETIEWIPFNRLSEVKEIGKGGFGLVYKAIWLDGIRKVEKIKKIDDSNSDDDHIYKRAREPSSIVALKTLANSKENNFDFLKEFKSLIACKINHSDLAIYGITQNTKTKEYMMVFQYANNGSLHKYLKENFIKLTWQAKLRILKNIAYELYPIHDHAGYIHANFHSGNILQDQQSYIADLGLSRKKDKKGLEGDIYGVMPYVAPEVLSGEQQFTQAADIYGFGVIMTEMTSGQRPFDDCKFDTNLAVKICKGLRPKFAPGTPKCYIELAEKCMDSDPQKRSSALDIGNKINYWHDKIAISNINKIKDWFKKIANSNNNEFKDLLKKITSTTDKQFQDLINKIDDDEIQDWFCKIVNSNDNEIKDLQLMLASSNNFNVIENWLEKIASNKIAKQFLDADKVIKSLPISKHSDKIYTSKIISTKLVSKAIKDLSQVV